MMAQSQPIVSVVIPVLGDEDALAALLPTIPRDPRIEVIVVDGGAPGSAAMSSLAGRHQHVRWMQSPPGRAAQMNRGAASASGRWLLFLHADTRLGPAWFDAVSALGDEPRVVGGSFRFALDSAARWARWIERGVRLRVRVFGSAYGDQALFVRRTVFQDMNGYRDLPLMEDLDFIRRLGRRGRLEHLDVPAVTSARRWERDGWLRRTLENRLLVLMFLAGCPPARLARRYRGTRQPPAGRPVVAIVARAPSAVGKTRLVAALGIEDGRSLREALLRDSLDSVAAVAAARALLFTPADAEAELRELAPAGTLFVPQRGDTLGERMWRGASDLFLAGFDPVVLIGSDAPTLPEAHIRQAVAFLARSRDAVVLGPADDGGYYLIGFRRAHAELFRDIPWGTEAVLDRTVRAARALGLHVELLPPWHDVDTVADLRRVCRGSNGVNGSGRHTRAWIAATAPAVRRQVSVDDNGE
jgi:rSAM/selenodomain-associated transferase 2/rSAM/selenodomain-associated transferase 1